MSAAGWAWLLGGGGVAFFTARAIRRSADLESRIDGLSDGLEPLPVSEADPAELAMGIEVEAEHTSDPALRQRIALQHLAEDRRYYSKLKRVGL